MKRIEITQMGTAHCDACRIFVVKLPNEIDPKTINWDQWADDRDIEWNFEDFGDRHTVSSDGDVDIAENDESDEALEVSAEEIASYRW
jgi:hypothetical protein